MSDQGKADRASGDLTPPRQARHTMSDDRPRRLEHMAAVPARHRRRSYRHAVSWAFYGVYFSVLMGQSPFILRTMGATAGEALMVRYGQALPMLLCLAWIPFIERRNPVRFAGLLFILAGVTMTFAGLTANTLALGLVLAMSGALCMIARPALGTALQQVYPARWRGKLMSMPNTSAMVARIACALAVGHLLARSIGYCRQVFPVIGLCMVAAGLVFRGIGGSRGGRTQGAAEAAEPAWRRIANSVRGPLRNRMLLTFLVGYFITTFGGVTYSNAAPMFARDQLSLTTAQWGCATAGYQVTTLICFYFWGVFLDRFGAPLTMIVCWSCQVFATALMFFAGGWWSFFAIHSARGIFMSGNILAFFLMVMHFTRSSETTRGMGLHFTFWGLRWIFATMLVAQVVDRAVFPTRNLFLVSPALMALGVAVMATVWLRERRTGGEGEPGASGLAAVGTDAV